MVSPSSSWPTTSSAVIGPDVTVVTGEEAADDAASQITDALSFFNIILLVFALIALFVGSFLILNTFSMLISQRTRELALLRAVGATRGQVTRSLLGESLVVGAVSSVLGCIVGIGVVYACFAGSSAASASISAARHFSWSREPSGSASPSAIVFTVAAAWFPARRAPPRSRRLPLCATTHDSWQGPAHRAGNRRRPSDPRRRWFTGHGGRIWRSGSSGASLVGIGVLLLLDRNDHFQPRAGLAGRPRTRLASAPTLRNRGQVGSRQRVTPATYGRPQRRRR